MMVVRPEVAETRDQYTFRPGTQTVPFFAGPKVLNRPHAITADATIPAGGAEGVLLSSGTAVGGWTFYMKDGRLHYVHNYVRREMHGVSAPDPVPEGRHELRFEFEPTGAPDIPNGKGAPGRAQLYVDGELVAENEIPVTIPIIIAPGGMTCGADPGITGQPGLPGPVPLHRRAPHRDRRPQRRAHRRPRKRAPRGHGTPIGGPRSPGRREDIDGLNRGWAAESPTGGAGTAASHRAGRSGPCDASVSQGVFAEKAESNRHPNRLMTAGRRPSTIGGGR